MRREIRKEDVVLAQGIIDTRATLREWNRDPWPVLSSWLGGSLVIAVALLTAVYVVASVSVPDPTPVLLAGVTGPATVADVGHVLYRNAVVLALHAMACVAGFIAGSSLPQTAARYTGFWRWVHDKAGPLAIGFVICATTFSLTTQAYLLGGGASTAAAHLGMTPGVLLLAVLPHALPELLALFLPLSAWVLARKAGEWHRLLAATIVTTSVAVPVLVLSAVVEVYVSPRLLLSLAA